MEVMRKLGCGTMGDRSPSVQHPPNPPTPLPANHHRSSPPVTSPEHGGTRPVPVPEELEALDLSYSPSPDPVSPSLHHYRAQLTLVSLQGSPARTDEASNSREEDNNGGIFLKRYGSKPSPEYCKPCRKVPSTGKGILLGSPTTPSLPLHEPGSCRPVEAAVHHRCSRESQAAPSPAAPHHQARAD